MRNSDRFEMLEGQINRLSRTVRVLAENGEKMAKIVAKQTFTIEELTKLVIEGKKHETQIIPDDVGPSAGSGDDGGKRETKRVRR